ncbi:hypothetical protein ACFSL4_01425 [Streptomyces caeni]|uniref:Uncharacterized protein n=1 Tax=Streptomyces caeni TaxID=2307231 RepID=A0ABW4IJ35_9ACTN
MVIFASGLGVIIITEGLFLRRLLGELAELRRQITGIERTMRADRAHVKALRQLLAEDDEEDEPPLVAAVIGNGGSPPPDIGLPIRHLPGLLATRKHLSVLKGGGICAVLTIAADALRAGRGHITGALAGSAVTATTVTLLTVTPWATGAGHQTPPAAPAPPPSALSPGSHPPQLVRSQTTPVAATSPAPPEPSPSASSTPSPTPLPDTEPDASEAMLADEQPAEDGSPQPADDATATASKSPPGASHTTGPPATRPPRAPGGPGRARGRSRGCSAAGVHGCSARG